MHICYMLVFFAETANLNNMLPPRYQQLLVDADPGDLVLLGYRDSHSSTLPTYRLVSLLASCSHYPNIAAPQDRIAWTLAISRHSERVAVDTRTMRCPEHAPLSEFIGKGCTMILRPDRADASVTGFNGFVPEDPQSVRGPNGRSRLVYLKPRRSTSRENLANLTDAAQSAKHVPGTDNDSWSIDTDGSSRSLGLFHDDASSSSSSTGSRESLASVVESHLVGPSTKSVQSQSLTRRPAHLLKHVDAHEQPFLSLDAVIGKATRQAKLPTTSLDF
ncbi:hypothetical protein AC579_9294 [Pseudocercospora musae]|uniref:Uncharacterized protein n=1 Tax=Pseudocercospora musae TaxID=113226 RepID=A0A139I584_9PEZI|nr:hypothetical protein AC579_9294 [Pseudocercospora musae]